MTEPQPPRLIDQVRRVLRLKHMSMRTEESYVYYIRDFIIFQDPERVFMYATSVV
jgi:hypothetical protein